MVFAEIDTLKQKWTDKYVIVDDSRPELRRFTGQTGTVKTVNMSGRCLVQFDGHNNIGWYDIDPTFLKVIDQPLPKPDAKAKGGEKPKKDVPAGKAAPTTPAPEVTKAKAAPAAGGGKSVADILAAARGGAKGAAPAAAATKAEKPAAAAPAAKADAAKMSVADIIAAAKGKAAAGGAPAAAKAEPKAAAPAATPAKVDPKKMSVADIIAAAKGKPTAGGSAPAKPSVAETLEASRTFPSEEALPASEEETNAPDPVATKNDSAGGKQSKKDAFKSVNEIVAYCRKVDASA